MSVIDSPSSAGPYTPERPMHPSPMAETSSVLWPSRRVEIATTMDPSLRGPIVSDLVARDDLADGLGEGVDCDGLADDGVHGGRPLALHVHEIAEAGQHDDRLAGGDLLDRGGQLITTHLRHR